MSNSAATRTFDQATLYLAAAKIGCSLPTAKKALEHGAEALKSRFQRERAAAFIAELATTKCNPSEAPARVA